MADDLEPALATLGALTDPVRRAAYRVVAGAAGPIGRDEVASALGVGRTLAAHHLDKLVDAGLLEVSYARRSGRTGPGAGRPAKLYRRTAGEHTVSVPPRAYRAAAELFAEAVERSGADATLYAVAREHGRARVSPTADIVATLTDQGYEPEVDGSVVRLRNCPFHLLAEEFPPLVCGMNLALLEGILDGAGLTACRARLDPEPGRCCVVIDKL
ncbi:MAG TPA: transcriptional regulator [Pilimelia sp.]|nr:transcriptional regulator [Pilimelia sp.]